jgi:hypothetical protein
MVLFPHHERTVTLIEYTSRNGNRILYATPQELEALPGYRPS